MQELKGKEKALKKYKKMNGKIAHIQINVSDFEKSRKFYLEFFKILGWKKFYEPKDDEKLISWVSPEGFSFWIFETEEKFKENKFHRKQTGLNHIAFKTNSKEKVDEFFDKFLNDKKEIILYGRPKEYPEYGKGYYAVYFEDPNKIKLELTYYPK